MGWMQVLRVGWIYCTVREDFDWSWVNAMHMCTDHLLSFWKAAGPESRKLLQNDNTTTLFTSTPLTLYNNFNVLADIMHQRLGNLHSAVLHWFFENGLKSKCTTCLLSKSRCKVFPSSLPKSSRLLFCVHSNVVGPIKTITPSGKRYFLSFIDGASM